MVLRETLHLPRVALQPQVEYRLRSRPWKSRQTTAMASLMGKSDPSMQRDEWATTSNDAHTKVISAPRRGERGAQVAEATLSPTSTGCGV